MNINCVDVSSYQGKIDWAKVKKSGVDYAILRSIKKGLKIDPYFEENYKAAKAAGLKVGIYLFSYAKDANYAKCEANETLSLLNGRKLDLPIFYDLETQYLLDAAANKVHQIASTYQKIIENAGYTFAIYCNQSFYDTKNHFVGYDSKCEFWIAKYGKNDGVQHALPSIKHHLIAHQFSDQGVVPGINGKCDVNVWYGAKSSAKETTNTAAKTTTSAGKSELELRSSVAHFGVPYVGLKEGDSKHKEILNKFNSVYKGYTVTTKDAWCQTYASTTGIANNLSDIIPVECSCARAIELWKKIGRWKESDSYTPKMGDYIYYDWQDDGKGDNTGWPDHVGIVYSVVGSMITVIEGNYHDSVGFRTISVDGKYIRGYGIPDYASKATVKESITSNPAPANQETKKVVTSIPAQKRDDSLAGTYVVTAENALNVREGAGKEHKVLVAIPRNTQVKNYGYYSVYNNVKWLLVAFDFNGVSYIGFASSNYLKKK